MQYTLFEVRKSTYISTQRRDIIMQCPFFCLLKHWVEDRFDTLSFQRKLLATLEYEKLDSIS